MPLEVLILKDSGLQVLAIYISDGKNLTKYTPVLIDNSSRFFITKLPTDAREKLELLVEKLGYTLEVQKLGE